MTITPLASEKIPTEKDIAMRRRAVGVAMLIAASMLWSLAGVAVKLLELSPISFVVYRSLGAVLAMTIVAAFVPGRRPNPRWMLLSALIYTAVVTLFIMATTLKTAAMGILLQYTQPVWCAIFAWYFLRRRIDRRTMLALLIASAGVAAMILGQPRGGDWTGPLCGLLSGVAFGALILVLEQLDRASGGNVNPAQVVLYNNLGTILILLPFAFYKHSLVIPPWKLGAVAAVGVIQLALPYVLIQLSLRRVQSIDASLLTLLEPVLNPLLVAIMTTERPDRATYIGGAAILVALVLEATKKPQRPDENAKQSI